MKYRKERLDILFEQKRILSPEFSREREVLEEGLYKYISMHKKEIEKEHFKQGRSYGGSIIELIYSPSKIDLKEYLRLEIMDMEEDIENTPDREKAALEWIKKYADKEENVIKAIYLLIFANNKEKFLQIFNSPLLCQEKGQGG